MTSHAVASFIATSEQFSSKQFVGSRKQGNEGTGIR
jgi:hypothetical protein